VILDWFFGNGFDFESFDWEVPGYEILVKLTPGRLPTPLSYFAYSLPRKRKLFVNSKTTVNNHSFLSSSMALKGIFSLVVRSLADALVTCLQCFH
jgi:hypothetical protein